MLSAIAYVPSRRPQAAAPPEVAILDREKRICGGVAVASDLILTAAHCVAGLGSTIRWTTRAAWENSIARAFRARIQSSDKARDLAYLKTLLGAPKLNWRRQRGAKPGERFVVIAAAHDYRRMRGQIKARGFGAWVTSLDVQPGFSGSPAIGTDGAVIGIVRACLAKTPDGPCERDISLLSPL